MTNRIGFIGGGNMAASLIGGLLANGWQSSQLFVCEPNKDRANWLEQQFHVEIVASSDRLVEECDAILIAVKPQIMADVLEPLAEHFKKNQPLVVSIAAGITAQSIQTWLSGDYPVVRVMPNTPAMLGAGASGLFASKSTSQAQRDLASNLLSAVGIVAWVDSEEDIDSVTALSGSGPAYFMLFYQAMIEAAENAGLDREVATKLTLQTAVGAAKMVEQSNESISQLIDNVTSPGGTTEQALNALNEARAPDIIKTAFAAAKKRSAELAEQFGA
jgi:pyrroline-5-carboxylate reductase